MLQRVRLRLRKLSIGKRLGRQRISRWPHDHRQLIQARKLPWLLTTDERRFGHVLHPSQIHPTGKLANWAALAELGSAVVSHPAPKVPSMNAHSTSGPRNPVVDLEAILTVVAAATAVTAAVAFGLDLLLRYTCYQAILYAGGSQMTLSDTPEGIFIPDDVASPAITAWVIGYHASTVLALVVGATAGALITTRTSPQAITILNSPGDSATHAKQLFRCIAKETVATLATLVLTLAAGILTFIVAVMFPAAVTAITEALPIATTPGPAVLSWPAILVGLVFGFAACLFATRPVDRFVQAYLAQVT